MYNMGNLAEISEEQEEAELREAFKVIYQTNKIERFNQTHTNDKLSLI